MYGARFRLVVIIQSQDCDWPVRDTVQMKEKSRSHLGAEALKKLSGTTVLTRDVAKSVCFSLISMSPYLPRVEAGGSSEHFQLACSSSWPFQVWCEIANGLYISASMRFRPCAIAIDIGLRHCLSKLAQTRHDMPETNLYMEGLCLCSL